MTDPKFGVGEAAASAPRLERGDFSNVVAVFRRYAADVRRQGEGDPACNQEAEAWQRAAEMLEHEQAARAPREPLEPELAPGIDILVSVNAALHAVNSAWRIDLQQGQAIAVPTPDVHSEFMAAARSALSPPELMEPADAIYLSDLAHDHAAQVQAGSESVEHALRTVAVCAYEHGIAVLPRVPEPDLAALQTMIAQIEQDAPVVAKSVTWTALKHVLFAWLIEVRAARAGAEAPPPEEPK
jgi:hypothetical protein